MNEENTMKQQMAVLMEIGLDLMEHMDYARLATLSKRMLDAYVAAGFTHEEAFGIVLKSIQPVKLG